MLRAATVVALTIACGTTDEPTPTKAPPPRDTGGPPPVTSTAETAEDTGQLETPTVSVTLRLAWPRLDDLAQIFVADRDGVYVRTETTTERELVVDEVPEGGSVTQRFETVAGQARLVTIGNLADGDVLHFPSFDGPDDEPLGLYTLEIATSPAEPFSFVEVVSNCASQAVNTLPLNASVGLESGCHDGTTVDAFALASSPTLQPVATAFVVDAPLDGTAPGFTGTVPLGPWSADFAEVLGRYSHSGLTGSLNVRTQARRNGRVAPQGLLQTLTIVDGAATELATPVEAAFHDEVHFSLDFVPAGSPTNAAVVVSELALPAAGNVGVVSLTAADLPAIPDAWSLTQGTSLSATLLLPVGWTCGDDSFPDVAEIVLEDDQVTWTAYVGWNALVTLPQLDPAFDPRPEGGFPRGSLAVHGAPIEWDALRQLPELSEGPSAWLSTLDEDARVCTNRTSL